MARPEERDERAFTLKWLVCTEQKEMLQPIGVTEGSLQIYETRAALTQASTILNALRIHNTEHN